MILRAQVSGRAKDEVRLPLVGRQLVDQSDKVSIVGDAQALPLLTRRIAAGLVLGEQTIPPRSIHN